MTWTAGATVNNADRASSGDGVCDVATAGVGDSAEAAMATLCAVLREARS